MPEQYLLLGARSQKAGCRQLLCLLSGARPSGVPVLERGAMGHFSVGSRLTAWLQVLALPLSKLSDPGQVILRDWPQFPHL